MRKQQIFTEWVLKKAALPVHICMQTACITELEFEQDAEKAMEYYEYLMEVQGSQDDYGTAAYMLGMIYEEGIYAEQ